MTLEETLTADPGLRDGGAVRSFLFVALQGSSPLRGSMRVALDDVDTVVIGRGEGPPRREGRHVELFFPDRLMSSEHARIERRQSGFAVADLGSKNGVFVNDAPSGDRLLGDGDRLELGNCFFVFRRLRTAVPFGDVTAGAQREEDAPLVTVRPDLEARMGELARAATSLVPLVILGESGTGKELLARAVHRISRRPGPLVAVNCGAIAATLVESELFGHVKGAFSGAIADHPGLVRASDGGTLFLDEVGELSPAAQVALLRTLQDHEVRPVGAVKAVAVDLRIVCATHRELSSLVAEQRFRPDLLARLSGFTMSLPPLRERIEELGTIVATILAGAAPQATLSRAAARRLLAHSWPLNTRELAQRLTTAALLGSGQIELEHLRLDGASVSDPSSPTPELLPEDAARREQLIELMRKHGGNVSAVARELGKERVQIRRWLKRYHIV